MIFSTQNFINLINSVFEFASIKIIALVVVIYFLIYILDRVLEIIFKPKIGRNRNRLQKTIYKSVKITDFLFHITSSILIVDKVLEVYKFPALLIHITYLIFIIYIVRIIDNLLLFSSAFYFEKKLGEKSLSEFELIKNLGILPILYKIVIYSSASVIYINYLGIEISDLLATLGVSSIIIAFALQSVLQDLFASFSVFLDKPFEVGDYIKTDLEEGVVTKVGFRSTRVRSKTGELIIIPNKLISDGKIRNFKQITERKVFNIISVDGNSDPIMIKKTMKDIELLFNKIDELLFSRVSIFDISNGVIKIEIVFFTKDDNFEKYAENTTKLNLKILELLEKNQIKLKNQYLIDR